jgi:DNA-binding NtrC family response regulator
MGALPFAGRILVVDDDPAARVSLRELLEDSFEVEVAAGAAEAEAALRDGAFDVVVADYEMPGGSGLELLQRLSKDAPGVVGVLLTGHREHPEVRRAAHAPYVFIVLQKSYHPDFIVDWIRKAATYSRARRQLERRKK